MSEQPNNQYLTINLFKKMIGATDNQDDDRYLQFVFDANEKVQTVIFRYIDTPLDEGSIYWSRCKNAALAFARSLHAEDIELIDKSKHYMGKFNIELYGAEGTEDYPKVGGLIQQLIATRTNRTKVVVARHDPRDFKVTMPTQIRDLAASSRFQ